MKSLLMFFGWFASCSQEPQEPTPSGLACLNSVDCPSGELCLEKTCQPVECVTSLDCQLEAFCTSEFTCQDGCKEDSDCFSGDQCNVAVAQCESYGCRNTELDCQVGQFCNPANSQCYDGGDFCQICTSDDVFYEPPENGLCVNVSAGDSCEVNRMIVTSTNSNCTASEVCVPNDVEQFDQAPPYQFVPGTCVTFYNFLYLDMLPQGECPAGFAAGSLPFSDNTLSDPLCLGECQYFIANGYVQ